MKKELLSILCGVGMFGGFAQAKEIQSIAMTVGDLGNPFFVQLANGARDAAYEKIGKDVEFTVVSSAYDLGRQTQQIDDFIAAGVDVILLGAADSQGIFPAVRRAQEAGILVVAIDVNAEGADLTVTLDNEKAGYIACEYLVEQKGEKGDFLIINGPPVSSIMDRVVGCKKLLAKYPDINLISDNQNAGASREGGLEVMTAMLAAYPKIDAVFAVNDPTAIGANLAARQAERNEFIITGVDGAPDAEIALAEDNTLFKATANQDPHFMSYKAVEVAIDYLADKKVDKTTLTPTRIITKDNLDDYEGWGNKNKK